MSVGPSHRMCELTATYAGKPKDSTDILSASQRIRIPAPRTAAQLRDPRRKATPSGWLPLRKCGKIFEDLRKWMLPSTTRMSWEPDTSVGFIDYSRRVHSHACRCSCNHYHYHPFPPGRHVERILGVIWSVERHFVWVFRPLLSKQAAAMG